MPEGLRLRHRPASSLRCPYCHDDLDGELAQCPLCAASYHTECAETCLSLGCSGILETPDLPQKTKPKLASLPRLAALIMALSLSALLLNFIVGGPSVLSALSALIAEMALLGLAGLGLTALYRRFALPAYLAAKPPTPAKMAQRSSLQPPARLRDL